MWWQLQFISKQLHPAAGLTLKFPSQKTFKGVSLNAVNARKAVLCQYLTDVAILPQAINAEIVEWFIGDTPRMALTRASITHISNLRVSETRRQGVEALTNG